MKVNTDKYKSSDSYLACIVFLLFLLLLISSCNKTNLVKYPPNIVLINVDDLGWKDAGFMSSTYYETPNLDQLAKKGMIFTNGYAAAANCAPSRACLMTGKWVSRHGIYTVGSSERGQSKHRKLIPAVNTDTLSHDFAVIARILQQEGYTCYHAGKWHLGDDPLDYGFNINIGGGKNGHPGSYYPPYKNVHLRAGKSQYLTDLVMEKTLEFVDTVQRPFFLNYAPYAVHTPINPVDSLIDKYKNKPGSNGQDNPAYASMIENLDRNIGLLISKFEQKKLLDNTFIVFTSDNGGLYGITKQKPLRAGKGSFYEGGIRVPFFIVWNGKIRPNSRSDVPITQLDLFPTILNLCGLESKPFEPDGQDLYPILQNKLKNLERPLYWHFPIYLEAYNKMDNENRDILFRTRPGSVIRKGDWKLHYYFENNEIELYNLAEDIGEMHDLSKINPDKTKELMRLLTSWWDKTNAPIPERINSEYEE